MPGASRFPGASRPHPQLLQGREPIRPIGFPADQTHENAARVRKRAFDIGVDRERMTKLRQVREEAGAKKKKNADEKKGADEPPAAAPADGKKPAPTKKPKQ